MLSVKSISRIKRRADRGRAYMSYIQVLATTTILVKIFNINSWWVYVSGAILVLSLCWLFGYMDEKMNILKNEQEGYNQQNPTIQRIEDGIELLKRRLL
jgi:hypothetical protein